jgi:hypothetical protein
MVMGDSEPRLAKGEFLNLGSRLLSKGRADWPPLLVLSSWRWLLVTLFGVRDAKSKHPQCGEMLAATKFFLKVGGAA